MEGKEAKTSLEKALKWYRKAAEAGNSDAKIKMGDFYRDGIGVRQSYVKARNWYQDAAEKECFEAKERLWNIEDRIANIKRSKNK